MEDINHILRDAIFNDDINLLVELLNEFSFDMWDDSIIIDAINSRQIHMIDLLVDHGFNLNHDCYSGGSYPLEKAIEIGYSCEEIQHLLLLGANPNICSCAGTPLMSAVRQNDENITDLLIESKVDLNCQAEGGDTALMIAARNGYINVTKKLIISGANPNIVTVDDFPRTALVCASEFKNLEIFDYLFPLTHSEEQRNLAIKYFEKVE
jgi:ankyrin repeat protein